MTDTQDRIIKGCKFIINLGSTRWESDQTRRALKRLHFLIEVELEMAGQPDPEATPEMAEEIFKV